MEVIVKMNKNSRDLFKTNGKFLSKLILDEFQNALEKMSKETKSLKKKFENNIYYYKSNYRIIT